MRRLLPERQHAPMVDLDEDLFVSCAHQTACCDLYYRYGMYLAPATAVLTTVKHCDWPSFYSLVKLHGNTQAGLRNVALREKYATFFGLRKCLRFVALRVARKWALLLPLFL